MRARWTAAALLCVGPSESGTSISLRAAIGMRLSIRGLPWCTDVHYLGGLAYTTHAPRLEFAILCAVCLAAFRVPSVRTLPWALTLASHARPTTKWPRRGDDSDARRPRGNRLPCHASPPHQPATSRRHTLFRTVSHRFAPFRTVSQNSCKLRKIYAQFTPDFARNSRRFAAVSHCFAPLRGAYSL